MSAKIKINGWDELSHSLHELLLLSGKIPSGTSSAQVDLSTPLTKFDRGGEPEFKLDIPVVSAAMQAVTGPKMAITLGELGGTGVIFCSQTPDEQAAMVREVSEYKLEKGRDFVVSAAMNTRDYKKRVPLLVDAGVDVLYIDTSQAHNDYTMDNLHFVQKEFEASVIAGNIVTEDAFRFFAEEGANGIKVGMGTGSICITQEQIGVGRGQASAMYEVAMARDEWYECEDVYIPIISDGGAWLARHFSVALALGADSVMSGKYLVGAKESRSGPIEVDMKDDKGEIIIEDGEPKKKLMKPYWGEGSAKAKAWAGKRYGHTSFDEGIEILVDYVGPLEEYLAPRLMMMKDGIRKAGAGSIADLHENGVELELISPYLLLKNSEKSLIAKMYRS